MDYIEIIRKSVDLYRNEEGSLIMILHSIQETLNYIPQDAAFFISEELDEPLAKIYEIITFYNYFRTKPKGKVVISVCLGTSCYLKGAKILIQELKNILGISCGETTKDGLFSLQTVRCLGCCGTSPVIKIGDRIYSKLTPSELKPLIEYVRSSILGSSNDIKYR